MNLHKTQSRFSHGEIMFLVKTLKLTIVGTRTSFRDVNCVDHSLADAWCAGLPSPRRQPSPC